jgi:RluA family pseudouridine synthase
MMDGEFDQCDPPVIAWGPGWLVASKPSGISVHNDPGADLCTVLEQYLKTHPAAAGSAGYDAAYGLHPVHRLDKATSGVILLSCRRDVFDALSKQIAGHAVTKEYLALVHGEVAMADDWQLWAWPLTAKAGGRRNPQGKGRRRPCQTKFRVETRSRHYSLLRCRLLTGRTHQIRRHAALAGHPLVGDKRYGSLRACRYLETHFRFARLGLHAAALTIWLPGRNSPERFEATGLPTALRRLIEQDIQDRSSH